MSVSLSAMSVFALVGAITPGPVNVLAVRHGATGRVSIPVLFVLGASLSYALVVWLVGAGAVHVLNHPYLVELTQWVGAGYLLYLAWRIAIAPVGDLGEKSASQQGKVWSGFIEGIAAQALNPKAWLVALSGVGLFVLPQENAGTALRWFCATSLVACVLGVGCWAAMGRLLVRWLASPARQRGFYRLLSLTLAITVIYMVL